MTPELLALVAERFKALSEPARLQIVNCLRTGEKTVTDVVDETGFGQSNVSRHLRVLHEQSLVARRKEGLFTYYSLADDSVAKLCDLMCGRIEFEVKRRHRAVVGGASFR